VLATRMGWVVAEVMAGETAMGVGIRRTVEEAGVLFEDEAVALALAAQALLNGVL
jgi:hypothetical protein